MYTSSLKLAVIYNSQTVCKGYIEGNSPFLGSRARFVARIIDRANLCHQKQKCLLSTETAVFKRGAMNLSYTRQPGCEVDTMVG